jgi:cellulose synthase/poly-beta-1,6-N-acetylglucosamine synthase-like glycosyltransferase
MLLEIISLSSLIFLFIALNAKRPKYKKGYYPPVSVISWFWKDGNIVERKIKNFLSLDYPGKFEIIIVDNASKDETRDICMKYAKKGKIKYFRAVREFDRKAYALDEAIKRVAKYDILAMTDPDGVCEKGWLKKMMQPFRDENVGAVIGVTHCGNFYKNIFTKLRAVEDEWFCTISPLGRGSEIDVNLINGANYAVRREALKSVGYHGKKTLVEDFELTIKLHAKKWKVKTTDADVWQEEVEDLDEYVRQRVRWQGSSAEAMWYYAKTLSKLIMKRPHGFLLFLISSFISLFSLVYFTMMIYGILFSTRYFILGSFGWIILNMALIYGLEKFKRKHLAEYVPIFLVCEPGLNIMIFLIFAALRITGKKVLWRSLHEGYYHDGTKLVLK